MAFRKTRQFRETQALRASGLSLARAANYAQNHKRRSVWVLAATLSLSAGYVGIAAVFGLQAVTPPVVETVRVEVVEVPQQLTSQAREEIFLAEQARRAPAIDLRAPGVGVVAQARRPAQADLTEPAPRPVAAALRVDTAPEPDCVNQIAAMADGLRVPFDLGSVIPTGDALATAAAMAAQVQTCPQALVSVEGHSDGSGANYLNLQLSWSRAENVIAYFADAGLETMAFRAIGYGARKPAAEGDADIEDAANRRVEFSVTRRTTPLNAQTEGN